jgi:RNA polymerase sigma-70 factor (sigma-E family)
MQEPPEGFAEFVRARSDALLRSAWLLTGDTGRAEDLLQTALTKAWRNWSTVEQPEAYVRRMLFTTYVSAWRRQWRGELPSGTVPEAVGTHDMASEVATRDIVKRALGRLSRRARAIVVLRYIEDRPVAEVAELLGCSPETVKSLASRAMAALREDLIITKRFPVQYMNVAGAVGYNVGQLITADGRRGDLIVTIELPQSSEPITCATQVAPERQSQCEDKTGPHGEHIVSLPLTGDGPGNRAHVVRVRRTDGSIVTVECGNATKMEVPTGPSHGETTDFGINTTSLTGKLPPLTIDQVTALALDPAITLYP